MNDATSSQIGTLHQNDRTANQSRTTTTAKFSGKLTRGPKRDQPTNTRPAHGEERNGDWRCPSYQSRRETVSTGYWCFCNSTNPIHAVVRVLAFVRVGVGTHARYNATLDLVPHAKPQRGWNATPHARSSHSVMGPMGKERAKRNGILLAGMSVDGRWGVVSTLARRFDTTTVLHVRCANPFDAGVGRRRKRCGVGEPVRCFMQGESPQIGGFGCDVCARVFDCGIHKCDKRCHRPSLQPSECPPSLSLSPTVLVGRAPSHCLPPLRDIRRTYIPLRSHSHLFETPHDAFSSMPSEMPHWDLPTMHNRDHASVQVWGNGAQSSLLRNPEQQSQ